MVPLISAPKKLCKIEMTELRDGVENDKTLENNLYEYPAFSVLIWNIFHASECSSIEEIGSWC